MPLAASSACSGGQATAIVVGEVSPHAACVLPRIPQAQNLPQDSRAKAKQREQRAGSLAAAQKYSSSAMMARPWPPTRTHHVEPAGPGQLGRLLGRGAGAPQHIMQGAAAAGAGGVWGGAWWAGVRPCFVGKVASASPVLLRMRASGEHAQAESGLSAFTGWQPAKTVPGR